MPILDSIKSLDDYIFRVALMACTSLVYSNNGIKAAQNGLGFSVLQLISLSIVHRTNFLAGYTRKELDITIYDLAVSYAPSLNEISMIMYNYKEKEDISWYKFLLADVQDLLVGYKNSMNKDE